MFSLSFPSCDCIYPHCPHVRVWQHTASSHQTARLAALSGAPSLSLPPLPAPPSTIRSMSRTRSHFLAAPHGEGSPGCVRRPAKRHHGAARHGTAQHGSVRSARFGSDGRPSAAGRIKSTGHSGAVLWSPPARSTLVCRGLVYVQCGRPPGDTAGLRRSARSLLQALSPAGRRRWAFSRRFRLQLFPGSAFAVHFYRTDGLGGLLSSYCYPSPFDRLSFLSISSFPIFTGRLIS